MKIHLIHGMGWITCGVPGVKKNEHIQVSWNPQDVTCGRCVKTGQYKHQLTFIQSPLYKRIQSLNIT